MTNQEDIYYVINSIYDVIAEFKNKEYSNDNFIYFKDKIRNILIYYKDVDKDKIKKLSKLIISIFSSYENDFKTALVRIEEDVLYFDQYLLFENIDKINKIVNSNDQNIFNTIINKLFCCLKK